MDFKKSSSNSIDETSIASRFQSQHISVLSCRHSLKPVLLLKRRQSVLPVQRWPQQLLLVAFFDKECPEKKRNRVSWFQIFYWSVFAHDWGSTRAKPFAMLKPEREFRIRLRTQSEPADCTFWRSFWVKSALDRCMRLLQSANVSMSCYFSYLLFKWFQATYDQRLKILLPSMSKKSSKKVSNWMLFLPFFSSSGGQRYSAGVLPKAHVIKTITPSPVLLRVAI